MPNGIRRSTFLYNFLTTLSPMTLALIGIALLTLLMALLLHFIQIYAFLHPDQARFPEIIKLRPHLAWLINLLVLLLTLMGFLILRYPNTFLNWPFVLFCFITIPTVIFLAIRRCLSIKEPNPKKSLNTLFIIENILLFGFILKEII